MAQPNKREELLFKILQVLKLVITSTHNQLLENFDQNPYHRVILGIIQDLLPDDIFQQTVESLNYFCHISDFLHNIQPSKYPGFSYAWLDIVSSRFYLPFMLNTVKKENQTEPCSSWKKFKVLLVDNFMFLEEILQRTPYSQEVKCYYEGTMRVLLVILHDFPEYLCNFH